MRVWHQAVIKLVTPGSAVRLATDCTMGPDCMHYINHFLWTKSISDFHIMQELEMVKINEPLKSHDITH